MSLEDSQPVNIKASPSQGIFITREQASAINVMIAAITVAQKAGAYSLKDSNIIYESLSCFRIDEEKKETQEEES